MFKRHMCFAGLSLLALVAGGAIAQPAKAPVEAVKPRAGANPAPARAAGEGAGPCNTNPRRPSSATLVASNTCAN